MAVKTIRICDICKKEDAFQQFAFSYKEFDGHRNEKFDHFYDVCDNCNKMLEREANIIAGSLDLDLTDVQYNMLKFKLMIWAQHLSKNK